MRMGCGDLFTIGVRLRSCGPVCGEGVETGAPSSASGVGTAENGPAGSTKAQVQVSIRERSRETRFLNCAWATRGAVVAGCGPAWAPDELTRSAAEN